MYTYKSESTDKEVSVLRSFEEYEQPPTEEEAEGDKGPWKRLIGNVTYRRGPNFTGSKGNWIAIIGAGLCLRFLDMYL